MTTISHAMSPESAMEGTIEVVFEGLICEARWRIEGRQLVVRRGSQSVSGALGDLAGHPSAYAKLLLLRLLRQKR